jgi:hypothetical protein
MSECVRCKNKVVITKKDYEDLRTLISQYVNPTFITCWTLGVESKNHPMFKRWQRLKRRLETIQRTQLLE